MIKIYSFWTVRGLTIYIILLYRSLLSRSVCMGVYWAHQAHWHNAYIVHSFHRRYIHIYFWSREGMCAMYGVCCRTIEKKNKYIDLPWACCVSANCAQNESCLSNFHSSTMFTRYFPASFQLFDDQFDQLVVDHRNTINTQFPTHRSCINDKPMHWRYELKSTKCWFQSENAVPSPSSFASWRDCVVGAIAEPALNSSKQQQHRGFIPIQTC